MKSLTVKQLGVVLLSVGVLACGRHALNGDGSPVGDGAGNGGRSEGGAGRDGGGGAGPGGASGGISFGGSTAGSTGGPAGRGGTGGITGVAGMSGRGGSTAGTSGRGGSTAGSMGPGMGGSFAGTFGRGGFSGEAGSFGRGGATAGSMGPGMGGSFGGSFAGTFGRGGTGVAGTFGRGGTGVAGTFGRGGAPVVPCTLTICNGVCVDTKHDPNNCGFCFGRCSPGDFCDEGMCNIRCGEPFIACNRACIDPRQDPVNCGACNKACPATQTCSAGVCICPMGLTACGTVCTNTSGDGMNCGACGRVCSTGQTCVSGMCRDGISRWPTLGGDIYHSGFNNNETGTPPLTPAWSKSLTNTALSPAVIDGTAIYVSGHGVFQDMSLVWALSPADGTEIWSRDFGDNYSIGQVTVDSGRLYFATSEINADSLLYSVSASNGATLWTRSLSRYFYYYGGRDFWAPLVVGPKIYVAGASYNGLLALNIADGSTVFSASVEPANEWTPLYLNGSIYTLTYGYLRRFDANTGYILAEINVATNYYYASMKTAPISDGSMVYFVAPPSLYGYRPSLGSTRSYWTIPGINPGGYQGMPAVSNGLVYSIYGGQMRANLAATGMTQWTVMADGALVYPPVGSGKWVYVASDANLYVVDTEARTATAQGVPGGWLSIAGGKLYVARADGVLAAYALTPKP